MAGGAEIPGGGLAPTVIRDLALLRRLMGPDPAKPGQAGGMRMCIPGTNGAPDQIVVWAIDPQAWNQQGQAPKGNGPTKEAA